jgi:hypothetical protein
MQVSKDELIDGSKGSYRYAYCPAESMDQLLLVWQGGLTGKQPSTAECSLSHAVIADEAVGDVRCEATLQGFLPTLGSSCEYCSPGLSLAAQ